MVCGVRLYRPRDVRERNHHAGIAAVHLVDQFDGFIFGSLQAADAFGSIGSRHAGRLVDQEHKAIAFKSRSLAARSEAAEQQQQR